MNDTKRLQVVFLVEYNKQLGVGTDVCAFCGLLTLLQHALWTAQSRQNAWKMHHSEAEN